MWYLLVSTSLEHLNNNVSEALGNQSVSALLGTGSEGSLALLVDIVELGLDGKHCRDSVQIMH